MSYAASAPSRRSLRLRGYTLLEMLIVVTIIGSVAVLVRPGFVDDSRLRLQAAASILASDIQYAQSLSISSPGDPALIHFETTSPSWWIARVSDPETPVNRTDNGQPYVVTLGGGRGASAAGVGYALIDMPLGEIGFTPQGALTSLFDNPQIELSMGDYTITLTVSAATGIVTEEAGEVAPAK